MSNEQRFLCICQYGHCRSVAMCRVLHSKGLSAVAVGWMTCGDAIVPLAEWATTIFTFDGAAVRCIPPDLSYKIVDFSALGRDVWSDPYNYQLAERLEAMYRDWQGQRCSL